MNLQSRDVFKELSLTVSSIKSLYMKYQVLEFEPLEPKERGSCLVEFGIL